MRQKETTPANCDDRSSRKSSSVLAHAKWGLMALAIGAGTSRADDWSTYQHDPQHTGRSEANFDASTLTKNWSAPQGYAIPLVIGSTVYAMNNQQGVGGPGVTTDVSSFNLSNGSVNWTYSNSFVFPSQPGYADGKLAFIGQTLGSTSSLYVLDAATGNQLYTVNLGSSFQGATAVMPTLAHDSNGHLTAFIEGGNLAEAVTLGAKSGSVAWTVSGSFGGSSMPTVVGNSVVIAGPGQYYAIDQLSGAENHFHAGNISGGGGTTVAYDAARKEFYVLSAYNTNQFNVLTAYSYTNNNTITQLWQYSGPGVQADSGVAIGPNGKIYSADNSNLVELDPTNGNLLRSVTGLSLANGITPALSRDDVIVYDQNNTLFYTLKDLTLEKTLPGSRGSLNSPYDGPGALSGNHFLLDYGNIFGSPGFDVYSSQITSVPEPSSLLLASLAVACLLAFGVARNAVSRILRVVNRSRSPARS